MDFVGCKGQETCAPSHTYPAPSMQISHSVLHHDYIVSTSLQLVTSWMIKDLIEPIPEFVKAHKSEN